MQGDESQKKVQLTCAKHQARTFLYTCPSCDRNLCGECIEKRDIGTTVLKSCPDCHVGIEPIGPGRVPLFVIVKEMVAQPFRTKNEITILVATAALTAVIDLLMTHNMIFLLNLLLWFVLPGIYASFVGAVVNSSAEGRVGIPVSIDYTNIVDDLIRPALLIVQAFFATFWPALLYFLLRLVHFGCGLAISKPTPVDLFVLSILALYGVVCCPMACAITLYSGNVSQAGNPAFVIKAVAKIPRGYFSSVGFLFLIAIGLGVVKGAFYLLLNRIGLPLIALFFTEKLFLFYGGYLYASVLGRMLYDQGAALGLPAVRKKKVYVKKPEPQIRDVGYDPLPAVAPAARDQTGSSLQSPALSASGLTLATEQTPPEQPKDPLEELCRNYKRGLQTNSFFVLEPELQYTVASRFEMERRWADAIEAYKKMGILGTNHPRAVDGLLCASFIAIEHVRDREAARSLLNLLISNYATSDKVETARKLLASISS